MDIWVIYPPGFKHQLFAVSFKYVKVTCCCFVYGRAASFTLPEQGSLLEDVLFVELCSEEAQKLLASYKDEATRLLPAPTRKRLKKRPHKRPIEAPGEENGGVRDQMIIIKKGEPRIVVVVK